MTHDPSNGYDNIADEFIRLRSDTGVDVVRRWAKGLPNGASVLDIGCGHGEPLTRVLIDAGLKVSAIDASPKMVAAFRNRFPDVEVACEPVQSSPFFDRKFNAVLLVGIIFLLQDDAQRAVLSRIAKALKPGGTLLFSAPRQKCEWEDVLTGRTSRSLGEAEYRHALGEAGVEVTETYEDEGGSYYLEGRKPD